MRFQLIALAAVTCCCSTASSKAAASDTNHLRRKLSTTSTVTYPSSIPYSTPLSNPERGFYTQLTYKASAPQRLNVNSLISNREASGESIILRMVYLDTFMNGPISQSVLDDVEADFESIRAAG